MLAAVAGLADPVPAADLSIATEFFRSREPVTVETAHGQPPAAAIRSHDGRLLGYAFSTRDVSGSVGYSGRPLDIVSAVTPDGIIAGARLVAHEEPILVIGIPREALIAYVANFRGYDVRSDSGLRTSGPGSRPHAVAGATITSTVIHDAILRSARAVLRTRMTVSGERARLDRETRQIMTWPELASEASVRRLQISRGEAAQMLGTRELEPDKPFIDLWLALATPPPVGESLLGRRTYESELAQIGPDDDLIVIGASGLYSFKGTAWRRSGLFERVEIVQGERTIPLRAEMHTSLDRFQAAAAPEFREIGVFRIPRSTGFDPTAAFRLDLWLTADPLARAATAKVSLPYRAVERYIVPRQASRPADDATRPDTAVAAGELRQAPLWYDIWRKRALEIGVLVLMLSGLGGILVFQSAAAKYRPAYHTLRTAYLIMTFVFLGFIANAQLSIVNVLTFIHALLSGFRWELFLLDPLVFILWGFVAMSLLFWGRGVFCGWLCPFGALQELINMVAQRLGVRQITIPFGVHERLWMIKYVFFLVILAVSLNSIMAAFGLAEIEPFKTAITMKFMRDWQFVSYAAALLFVGVFIERFYCRYLCPLGAALAIPARMRMFEWLKRYRECGAECHVCARQCTVQAIHPLGAINPNECVYCLKCQANYFDPATCLHLKKRAERRRGHDTSSPASAGGAAAPGGNANAR